MNLKLFFCATICIFLLTSVESFCQTEVGISVQGLRPLGLNKNVTVDRAPGYSYNISRNIKIVDYFLLEPQISYCIYSFVMDGMFYNSITGNYFDLTPDNYKQNKLDFHFVRLQLLVKQIINGELEEGKFYTLAIGPTLDAIITKKQKYKVGLEKLSNTIEIDRKFSGGFSLELLMYASPKKNSNFISYGAGANYQLTEYLKENKSFNTLALYLKLGFMFGRKSKK